MLVTIIFACAVLTIVYSVLAPVCHSMLENENRYYDEKFKAFKVVWLRRCYPELRAMPIETLYQNVEQFDSLYHSIGRQHL